MNLKQQAQQIYAESLKMERSKGCYYRRQAIQDAPEGDRYYLREYVAQIGRQRIRDSKRDPNQRVAVARKMEQ